MWLYSSAAASAPAALRSLRRTSQYASVARLAGAAQRRSRCDALFMKRTTPGAQGRHGAMAADPAPGTSAYTQDPEAGERVVELHRVLRTRGAQRGRDLLRHPPVRRLPPREPEPSPQARHVGVEGDDEIARRHGAPQAEVHSVRPPYHPPQEKVVPLARRPAFRAREEKVALAGQALPPSVAEPVEESGQVPPEGGGGLSPAGAVETLERPGGGGKPGAPALPGKGGKGDPARGRRPYGITLFSGYSTIPEAPSFLRRGISSRTIF